MQNIVLMKCKIIINFVFVLLGGKRIRRKKSSRTHTPHWTLYSTKNTGGYKQISAPQKGEHNLLPTHSAATWIVSKTA